jgi:putative transcriptional regulator
VPNGVPRAGSLLVASTDLLEPTFRRTVIYIIEHNEAGSLGVVLNRRSDTALHNILPAWEQYATRPKAVYVGGPVRRDSAICLGVLKLGADADAVRGLRRVDGRVVMVNLDADPESLSPVLEGVRVYAGYAGWTVGQLESELDREDWMVVSSLTRDVLCQPREDLWAKVLRRQPMPLAMLATHPIELERN